MRNLRNILIIILAFSFVLPQIHCGTKKYHGRKKRYKTHRKKPSHRQKRKCPCVENRIQYQPELEPQQGQFYC